MREFSRFRKVRNGRKKIVSNWFLILQLYNYLHQFVSGIRFCNLSHSWFGSGEHAWQPGT